MVGWPTCAAGTVETFHSRLQGPAITEIDSSHLRGGRRLIADLGIGWESRWECYGNTGIGLGFPGSWRIRPHQDRLWDRQAQGVRGLECI